MAMDWNSIFIMRSRKRRGYKFNVYIPTEGGDLDMAKNNYYLSNEVSFYELDYSDAVTIRKVLRNYEALKIIAYNTSNMELITICQDMENAFKNAKLTDKQKQVLKLYIEGWIEEDIGRMMDNITHQAVNKLIIKISTKISKYLSE